MPKVSFLLDAFTYIMHAWDASSCISLREHETSTKGQMAEAVFVHGLVHSTVDSAHINCYNNIQCKLIAIRKV